MVKFNFGLGDDDNAAGTDPTTDPQNTAAPIAGGSADPVVVQTNNPTPVQGEVLQQIPQTTSPEPEGISFDTSDDTNSEIQNIQEPENTAGATQGINFDFSQNEEPAPVQDTAQNTNDFSLGDNNQFPEPNPSIPTPEVTTPSEFSLETTQNSLNTQDNIAQDNTQVEPISAINPFQQEDAIPPVAEESVNINPFSETDNSVGVDVNDEQAFLGPEEEEGSFSVGTTGGNTVNATFPSLIEIKQGVLAFVQSHFDNIKTYKKQINELKDKIRKEEDILRSKKDEFNNLVKEIKGLADSFDESLPNDNQNKGRNNGNGGAPRRNSKPPHSKGKPAESENK